jgi:prevent-host-death family protein
MAISVGMHEAKTTLSRLVDAAQSGEEVVITRRGQPVVKLEPVSGTEPRISLFGALKGRIVIADDFDELPDDVVNAFAGDDPDDPLCS